MSSPWLDSPQRYGLVSRFFHWTMALVLAWQFTGMLAKVTLGRGSEVVAFLVGTHKPVGFLLMVLILLRGAWGLSQLKRRPPHPRTLVGRAAGIGHAVLYALMLYIPTVALMREFGRGNGFAPFGIQVFPETGEQIAWMIPLANASHGLLAWTMLALILGHVAMVIVHSLWWRDGTAARMAGKID